MADEWNKKGDNGIRYSLSIREDRLIRTAAGTPS